MKNILSRDNFRMVQWLLTAVALYVMAVFVPHPQIQTVLWKMGHITLAAFIGYWIDRHSFRDRVTDDADNLKQIRRAIIMGSAMLAIALGM